METRVELIAESNGILEAGAVLMSMCLANSRHCQACLPESPINAVFTEERHLPRLSKFIGMHELSVDIDRSWIT